MPKAKVNQCCKKPERLKNKPEQCSPKQIEECHGPSKSHPCVLEKQAKVN